MKIYFASVETCPDFLPDIKPKYILTTFYNMRTQNKTVQKILSYSNSEDCKGFLLDSGAFTFFSAGTQKSETEWLKYADDFSEFIIQHNIKKYFELDIDVLVGLDKVEKIRKRIESATKVPSIPVWHIDRGWKYFERMCDEYDYVAVGGLVSHPKLRYIEKTLPYFTEYAHKNGTRVHGLGYTSLDKAKLIGFDSVDSTSWLSGGRFGSLYKIKGSSIKAYNEKKSGKRLNSKKAHFYNMKVWATYAKFVDKEV